MLRVSRPCQTEHRFRAPRFTSIQDRDPVQPCSRSPARSCARRGSQGLNPQAIAIGRRSLAVHQNLIAGTAPARQTQGSGTHQGIGWLQIATANYLHRHHEGCAEACSTHRTGEQQARHCSGKQHHAQPEAGIASSVRPRRHRSRSANTRIHMDNICVPRGNRNPGNPEIYMAFFVLSVRGRPELHTVPTQLSGPLWCVVAAA